MIRNNPPQSRPGLAAVEFAVIAPLLAVVIIGLWEVGRLVEVQQMLANAAREGGRQASAGVKTSSQVQSDVVNFLKNNGISSATTSNVTITNLTKTSNGPEAADQLDRFRITITIPFNSVRWVLLNSITKVTNLTASADWYSMRDIPLTVSATIPLN